MYRLLSIVLALAVIASAAGCHKAPEAASVPSSAATSPTQATPPKPIPAQLPDVLARVNGAEVKKSDFDMLVRNMELGKGPIPADQRDRVLRGALDRLITYTVLKQEVKARNISVPDGDVEEHMKQMRSQFQNEEAFQKALAARGMSVERLRTDARDDMGIKKMLDAEVASAQVATDAEVREFYDKNPEKFKREEGVRASHILIKVDQTADESAKKKARSTIDGILKRARAGEDFAQLAQAHSQDGSAAQGGDLNCFARGQMVPAFDQAAFALQPGQISDVVTTQFGYHIIKVIDRRPSATVPLEEVSDRVKQFLTEQKKQERADAFVARLKEKSKIEVLI